MLKKSIAEFIGTFVLVLGGCGAAVLTAAFPDGGIGILGVSLAFGLTVLTMAYTIGHISGGHMNPAVSIGLWAGKRFPVSELLPYIVAQVLGAVVGAGVLYLIATGQPNFDIQQNGFATNGYAEQSPGGYSLVAGLITEIVLTFIFLTIILGDHRQARSPGFCAPGDWSGIDPGASGGHSGDKHVGQSGAQYGSGDLHGRRGVGTAVAVLGCPDHWSSAGRPGIPLLR